MPNEQQKSTRHISKRKFQHVSENLRRAALTLGELNEIYEKPHPTIGEACQELIKVISFCETCAWEIRKNL